LQQHQGDAPQLGNAFRGQGSPVGQSSRTTTVSKEGALPGSAAERGRLWSVMEDIKKGWSTNSAEDQLAGTRRSLNFISVPIMQRQRILGW